MIHDTVVHNCDVFKLFVQLESLMNEFAAFSAFIRVVRPENRINALRAEDMTARNDRCTKDGSVVIETHLKRSNQIIHFLNMEG